MVLDARRRERLLQQHGATGLAMVEVDVGEHGGAVIGHRGDHARDLRE